MNRSKGNQAGFTVIELLIASAIFIIILGALTSYFISSSRAMAVTEDLSDRQQEVEAAVNIMSYDLALAGYKGTTPTDISRTFAQPTLEVDKAVGGGSSDRLIIRYYEDTSRLFGGSETCGSPCMVTYEVDAEDGETNLYRQEGADIERGIVQRVEHFKIIQYILRDGSTITVDGGTPVPNDLAALNIEIAFATGGLWRFPVGISNVQN